MFDERRKLSPPAGEEQVIGTLPTEFNNDAVERYEARWDWRSLSKKKSYQGRLSCWNFLPIDEINVFSLCLYCLIFPCSDQPMLLK